MSMKCQICGHPKRYDMEREYFRGSNVHRIARKYEVGDTSLKNHLTNHTSRQMAQAWRKKQEVENLDMVKEIEDIIAHTHTILKRAEGKGNDHLSLKAIAELRQTYDLMLRIAVALHDVQREEKEEETEQRRLEEQDALMKRMKAILSPTEMALVKKINLKLFNEDKDRDVLAEILKERELKKTFSQMKRTRTLASKQRSQQGEGENTSPAPSPPENQEKPPENESSPPESIPYNKDLTPRQARRYWRGAHTNPYK